MHWIRTIDDWNLSRRELLAALGLGTGTALLPRARSGAQSPEASPAGSPPARAESLTIDISVEPSTLDPAVTYDPNGWSIVHSVYDSLLQYDNEGNLELLLAESWEWSSPTTIAVSLRPNVTFHNGEALTSKAVQFSLGHITAEKTASQVSANFKVIESFNEIDDLTFELVLSQPAPWLPSFMTGYLAILPPDYAASNDFARHPVGTGPYKFGSWSPGESIELEVNDGYFAGSPKGVPIADAVTYRFVPDATTRVADLLSGSAQLVTGVPVDQAQAVEDGNQQVVIQQVSGSAFVRAPNTIEPFIDPQVRAALNFAVDVQSIVDALLDGNGGRLANLFVSTSVGYDANLSAYAYDVDQAKSLLSTAGYAGGFSTTMDVSATERLDVAQAVAAQLGDAGIDVEVMQKELAVFNAPEQWTGEAADAAALRLISWRPLFDPYTLLSLMFSNTGFLSRFDDPTVQGLIDAFSTESDPDKRAEIGRELGKEMHDNPAAIYLYDLTAIYGVAEGTPPWSPRADEYVIACYRG
ncbi:MAG TPA: ABC transporter substrate-binding protein [Thermomicrobiales bacterium]|nr:ABC transporter substrate-binding protein [Thermomicrobiales bacterium]